MLYVHVYLLKDYYFLTAWLSAAATRRIKKRGSSPDSSAEKWGNRRGQQPARIVGYMYRYKSRVAL